MDEAVKRLEQEHKKIRERNNQLICGLLIFAVGYLLLKQSWIMVLGFAYLVFIVIRVNTGYKAIGNAYMKEEEECRAELKSLAAKAAGKEPESALRGLVCAYIEKGGRRERTLLCAAKESLYSFGDILDKRKVYTVSNQSTFLVSVKKHRGKPEIWPLPLAGESWTEKKERHLAYLSQWAQEKNDSGCLENFVYDWLLKDLVNRTPKPIGYAGARGKLKRQVLLECSLGEGTKLILTEEQAKRLGLSAEVHKRVR